VIRDNAGHSLTVKAAIGRRCFRWDHTEQAFGPPAILREARPTKSGIAIGLVLEFADGDQVLCTATEVMIPAVDREMVMAGALELQRSWPVLTDPLEAMEQADKAKAESALVLAAAIEGRTA
jgi:hypothetical protein